MLYFSLGDFVIHPTQPDWGLGQVQSIVGMKVTVNFEHAGKQMINCAIITLVVASLPWGRQQRIPHANYLGELPQLFIQAHEYLQGRISLVRF